MFARRWLKNPLWTLLLATCALQFGCGEPVPDLTQAKKCLAEARWTAAVEHLDEALRISPNSGGALILRGQAMIKLRKYSQAVEDLRRGHSLAPSPDSLKSLAEAELAAEHFAEAEALLTPTADQSADLLLLRGTARFELERTDDAIADLRKATELNSDLHEAWRCLGLVYVKKGDYRQADDCLSQSIALQGNNPLAFWLRSLARSKLGNSGGAEADRTTARELDPTVGFADSAMGQTMLRSVIENKNHSVANEDLNLRGPSE